MLSLSLFSSRSSRPQLITRQSSVFHSLTLSQQVFYQMPSYEGTVSITKEVGPCGYSPSEAPAVVFTMIFSALTIANFFQTIRTRYWFMLAVVFGVLCETIGSGLRIYGSFHPTVIAPYIAQQVSLNREGVLQNPSRHSRLTSSSSLSPPDAGHHRYHPSLFRCHPLHSIG